MLNQQPPMLQDYQRGIIDFAPPNVDALEYFKEKHRQRCAHLAAPLTPPLTETPSKTTKMDSLESKLESESDNKLRRIAEILKQDDSETEFATNQFERLPDNPRKGFKFHSRLLYESPAVEAAKKGVYYDFESRPKQRMLPVTDSCFAAKPRQKIKYDPTYVIDYQNCACSPRELEDLKKTLDLYPRNFARHKYDLGTAKVEPIDIKTTTDVPKPAKFLRTPPGCIQP